MRGSCSSFLFLAGIDFLIAPVLAQGHDSMDVVQTNLSIAKQEANAGKIPKKIWLTHKTEKKISQFYFDALRTLNPGYEVNFMNDSMAEKFIEDSYPAKYVDTYRKIQEPAHRADFWRYLVLLKKGGYYIDADNFPVESMDTISKGYDFVSVIANGNHGVHVHNGFIGTIPDNFLLQNLAAHFIQNPNPPADYRGFKYHFYVRYFYELMNNCMQGLTPLTAYSLPHLRTYFLYAEGDSVVDGHGALALKCGVSQPVKEVPDVHLPKFLSGLNIKTMDWWHPNKPPELHEVPAGCSGQQTPKQQEKQQDSPTRQQEANKQLDKLRQGAATAAKATFGIAGAKCRDKSYTMQNEAEHQCQEGFVCIGFQEGHQWGRCQDKLRRQARQQANEEAKLREEAKQKLAREAEHKRAEEATQKRAEEAKQKLEEARQKRAEEAKQRLAEGAKQKLEEEAKLKLGQEAKQRRAEEAKLKLQGKAKQRPAEEAKQTLEEKAKQRRAEQANEQQQPAKHRRHQDDNDQIRTTQPRGKPPPSRAAKDDNDQNHSAKRRHEANRPQHSAKRHRKDNEQQRAAKPHQKAKAQHPLAKRHTEANNQHHSAKHHQEAHSGRDAAKHQDAEIEAIKSVAVAEEHLATAEKRLAKATNKQQDLAKRQEGAATAAGTAGQGAKCRDESYTKRNDAQHQCQEGFVCTGFQEGGRWGACQTSSTTHKAN